MINLAIAWAIGLALWLALWMTPLRAIEAMVPALIAVPIAYVLLARRTVARMQAMMMQAQAWLQRSPPQFDRAVRDIERAYPLGRWQFGLAHQLDAQIGMIYFLQRDFARAAPYLKRALMWGPWVTGAMLGVVYYRKKDTASVEKTFQVVLKKGRKTPLAWCLWAYLLVQMGRRDEAQKLLAEGAAKLPHDLRLREALLALENGKKLKMRAFGEQWYQFHLERPPAQAAPPQAMQRMGRTARRGRW